MTGTPPANDTTVLTPSVPDAHSNLAFDFLALEVGVTEYAAGPTGCTAFAYPQPVLIASDIRGELPCTIMADDGIADGICVRAWWVYFCATFEQAA